MSDYAGEYQLIDQSLQNYTEMREMLKRLQCSFENRSTEELTDFNSSFSVLRENAERIDKRLFENIEFSRLPEQLGQLFEQRKIIIKEIMELLQITLPQANRVKSLLAAEMTSVGSGRKALGGYKPGVENQGRIINKAG